MENSVPKSLVSLTVSLMLLAVSNLPATTHCVSPTSANLMPPCTNWGTAATNIQEAVGTTTYTDTNPAAAPRHFYRVGGSTLDAIPVR